EQISEVISQFPEKALTILAGAESGNKNYMHSFDTNGGGAHSDFGYMSILLGLDHMTNDLIMVDSHWFTEFYQYTARETQVSRGSRTLWNFEYKVIYNMNSVLSSLLGDSTDPEVNSLKGRALAVRANAYMNLIRTFAVGNDCVPYYSECDEVIEHSARMATSEVWDRIMTELEKAYSLLKGIARSSNKEAVNEQVAATMLA